MTPIRQILLILTLLAITLSSCTSSKFSTNRSIQKRKYTKGWFINKQPRLQTSNSSQRTQEKQQKQFDLETEKKVSQTIATVEIATPNTAETTELEQEQSATNAVEESEIRSQDYVLTDQIEFNEIPTTGDALESSQRSDQQIVVEESTTSSNSSGMSKSKKNFILFLVFLAFCILILFVLSLDSIGWGAALLLGGAFLIFAILAIVAGIKALVLAGS